MSVITPTLLVHRGGSYGSKESRIHGSHLSILQATSNGLSCKIILSLQETKMTGMGKNILCVSEPLQSLGNEKNWARWCILPGLHCRNKTFPAVCMNKIQDTLAPVQFH